MTTNQTERVSDEELDQMIWKLERDGMTPKQLSLMRELRDVRRAKGEPVAWIVHARTGDQLTTDSGYVANAEGILGLHSTPLYTAPPAPPAYKKTENFTDYHAGWNACRAAMLNHSGNSEQLKPVSNRDELPATQFKPVADLYGITSPTGSETSFTFDANEAANFIEGGWSVQEYVELERYQEAMIGNSPATPDGWIPVSERVPPEGTPMLVCSGNGVVQRTVYGFDGENWLDWYEQYDLVKTEPDDLWQPLPESPRQE